MHADVRNPDHVRGHGVLLDAAKFVRVECKPWQRESGLENILLNMKILFKGKEMNIEFDLRLEDGGRTQTTLPTLVAPFILSR